MNDNSHIKIWQWGDAPEEFEKLSRHGGDEDWVLYCPKDKLNGYWPFGFYNILDAEDSEDSYVNGSGHVDRHVLENGDVVVIFAHA